MLLETLSEAQMASVFGKRAQRMYALLEPFRATRVYYRRVLGIYIKHLKLNNYWGRGCLFESPKKYLGPKMGRFQCILA